MEKPKRKSLAGLNEALKRIRRGPPDPRIVDEFNELMRKDEELEGRPREQATCEREGSRTDT